MLNMREGVIKVHNVELSIDWPFDQSFPSIIPNHNSMIVPESALVPAPRDRKYLSISYLLPLSAPARRPSCTSRWRPRSNPSSSRRTCCRASPGRETCKRILNILNFERSFGQGKYYPWFCQLCTANKGKVLLLKLFDKNDFINLLKPTALPKIMKLWIIESFQNFLRKFNI